MALTMFSGFQVGLIDGANATPTDRKTLITGIASLMAHIVALGSDKPIHIFEVESSPFHDTMRTNPGEWSLFGRHCKNGEWNWIVIGAQSLDDVAIELFEAIQGGNMSEIAICPPNTPMPRMGG
jgi:hypothetical protein